MDKTGLPRNKETEIRAVNFLCMFSPITSNNKGGGGGENAPHFLRDIGSEFTSFEKVRVMQQKN